MALINKDSDDDNPVINSRYSVVMAASKRARQIIGGNAGVSEQEAQKPLSTAVNELWRGDITIKSEDQEGEDEREIAEMMDKFVDENIPSEEETRKIIEERSEEAKEV